MSTLLNLKPVMHPYNRAVNNDMAVDPMHAPHSFSTVYHNRFSFTVSGVSAFPAVGQNYTNNSSTFNVVSVTDAGGGAGTIVADRTVGTNQPQTSGNLTEAATLGAGDTTIAFSAWTVSAEDAFSDIIPSGYMAMVRFYGNGKADDGSRFVFDIIQGVENISGTYTLIGSADKRICEDASGSDVAVTITGNVINLTVTPVGGKATVVKFGYEKLVS